MTHCQSQDKYFTRKPCINYISLPSTSPANAGINFDGLCEVWRQIDVVDKQKRSNTVVQMAIILLLCVVPYTLPAQSHAHFDLEEVVVRVAVPNWRTRVWLMLRN
ncbi:hypothetical protein [Candidatus Symbiothrix dinenymphae]|uniref:hypothetical protein n=1 Tax=Candidatus Symbiothrix dinenymphae TaxID=467085 RepID=UPI00070271E6|nr:hypothetical protein [Candidatus Symbiothrix dinenymphae]